MIRFTGFFLGALLALSAFADEEPGYSWKRCERADLGGMTIPFAPTGKFKPECAPDTLYSWQFDDRMERLYPFPGDRSAIRFEFLYTWRTPLLTWHFGTQLARIRLKPKVKFVPIDITKGDPNRRNCAGVEPNTIHVAYSYLPDKGLMQSEYILCDPAVVESWSLGTPESAEEIRREQAWIIGRAPAEYDHFSRAPDRDESKTAASLGLDFVDKLQKGVWLPERIFYAPGVPENRARHFSTKLPSYFNPNAEARAP